MEKSILQTVKRISQALDSCLLEHALIGGLAASIRGRARATEDSIIMKAMAGRAQDEQDIKGILDVHSQSLDWDYCIDISQQLQEAIGIDLVERIHNFKAEHTQSD